MSAFTEERELVPTESLQGSIEPVLATQKESVKKPIESLSETMESSEKSTIESNQQFKAQISDSSTKEVKEDQESSDTAADSESGAPDDPESDEDTHRKKRMVLRSHRQATKPQWKDDIDDEDEDFDDDGNFVSKRVTRQTSGQTRAHVPSRRLRQTGRNKGDMENTNYTGKMSRPVRYGKRQTADEDDFKVSKKNKTYDSSNEFGEKEAAASLLSLSDSFLQTMYIPEQPFHYILPSELGQMKKDDVGNKNSNIPLTMFYPPSGQLNEIMSRGYGYPNMMPYPQSLPNFQALLNNYKRCATHVKLAYQIYLHKSQLNGPMKGYMPIQPNYFNPQQNVTGKEERLVYDDPSRLQTVQPGYQKTPPSSGYVDSKFPYPQNFQQENMLYQIQSLGEQQNYLGMNMHSMYREYPHFLAQLHQAQLQGTPNQNGMHPNQLNQTTQSGSKTNSKASTNSTNTNVSSSSGSEITEKSNTQPNSPLSPSSNSVEKVSTPEKGEEESQINKYSEKPTPRNQMDITVIASSDSH